MATNESATVDMYSKAMTTNETTTVDMYSKAEEYWQGITPDVEGMLGGFANLSRLDIPESTSFLKTLHNKFKMGRVRSLDCGCGIGRVARHLLLPNFSTVDMVDVTHTFITASSEYLGPALDKRIGDKFICGLQNFTPKSNFYDLIWIQWCAGHLTHQDLVQFLQRCKAGLKVDGCIVLKENIAQTEESDFDEDDHSFTRPKSLLLQLFHQAGLQVILEKKQSKWVKGLFEVRAFALR